MSYPPSQPLPLSNPCDQLHIELLYSPSLAQWRLEVSVDVASFTANEEWGELVMALVLQPPLPGTRRHILGRESARRLVELHR